MLIESLSGSHSGVKPVCVPFHRSWYCNQHASGSRQAATEVGESEAHCRGSQRRQKSRATWFSRRECPNGGSQRCDSVFEYSCSHFSMKPFGFAWCMCLCVVMHAAHHTHPTLYLLSCTCLRYNLGHWLPRGLLYIVIKHCVVYFFSHFLPGCVL